MNNTMVKTKTLMLIAVFSALYFVLRMIPTFPMIGVSGGSFALADILAPLYGLILGPFIGGFSIIIGTFLAILAGKPIVFMGFDFLPALMNALIIGLIIKKKPVLAISLNALIFVLFLLHPYTAITVPIKFSQFETQFFFPWLHLIAFIILVSPVREKTVKWLSESLKTKIIAVSILTLIGTMVQHLTGSLLWETIYGIFMGKAPEAFKLLWRAIFWVYPFERVFIVIISVIIGVPLLKVKETLISKA
ncbi:MAG: ECF transporter S component [Candidatus Bathyarchaeia archaeon]|nr:ECF transporter S component [Candidatus Bathyarchaeota archaeon]